MKGSLANIRLLAPIHFDKAQPRVDSCQVQLHRLAQAGVANVRLIW